jgi:ATP-binding protein involved in chromosome partitioning
MILGLMYHLLPPHTRGNVLITEEKVLDALRTVYDPEFTMDIVTLNMVKAVRIDGTRVALDLVLTTPACPLAPFIKLKIERAIQQAAPEVTEVVSNILNEKWDPPEILGPMEIVYPDFVTITAAT